MPSLCPTTLLPSLAFLLGIAYGNRVEAEETPMCSSLEQNTSTIEILEETEIHNLFTPVNSCFTLIELWATWCKPCVELHPEMLRIASTYPHLHTITISADATDVVVTDFWKTHPAVGGTRRLHSWSLPGIKAEYATIGGNFQDSVPYLVLLDPTGKLIAEGYGIEDLAKIDALLANPTTPSIEEPPKKNRRKKKTAPTQ